MGQLQIALLMGAIALASGFTAGWKVNGWRYEAQRAAVEESISEALTATAKELAKIEVKNVTIRQQMETKVIERTIYHECKHEPDGVRLINEALNGKPVGNSKLPGVDTTSGK